jgi:hypothetical protein
VQANKLRQNLIRTSAFALLLSAITAVQSTHAQVGPTGAPKAGPSIVVPLSTPPIGGPVVLEPTGPQVPTVPRGAREPPQGQIARDVSRAALNLDSSCMRSPSETVRRFATISGRLQKGSTLTMTGRCFGTRSSGLSLVVQAGSSATSFFLPNPDDASGRPGWATFGLLSSNWTPNNLQFPVIYAPDPAQQPIAPPRIVRLEINTGAGLRFRADLTQRDIDALNSGTTLTNPPTQK